MKPLWLACILVVLAAGLAVTATLYWTQRGQLDSAVKSISSLKSEMANIENSKANLAVSSPTTGTHVIEIVGRMQPAVLRVDVTGRGFVASGSGFIIRADGYFITNHHVIESATSLQVALMNGQQLPASVKTSDSRLDLALCKIDSSRTDFPVLSLGLASDIAVGEDVVAIGFPLGTDLPGMASFTHGIVSALRTLANQRYLQTDVTINPGNSGGPLADYNLNVIGVTTSAVLPQGSDIENIGLAIPSDVVQAYLAANLK